MNDIEPLSDAARAFALEYVQHFNVGKAAASVGVSTQHGKTWLLDPRVNALINEQKRIASERVNLSVDLLLNKLLDILHSSPLDYFDRSDGGLGLKLNDLTEAQIGALKSIKFTKYGPAVETHDKIAAIRMLGQFLGIFTEKIELARGDRPDLITDDMTPQQAAEHYAKTIEHMA